jgi:hypothetical protein
MLLLLWSACGDSGPTVHLPSVPGATGVTGVPVVVVTPEAVWFDARPWSDQLPDAALGKVDTWATADTQGMLLPGLDAALATVGKPFEPALAVDGDVPFERVARVLYTVGQRSFPAVELRFDAGNGAEGAVRYEFPTYCGGTLGTPERAERLKTLLLAAPTGPCLAPSVTEVAGGMRVELLPVPQDKPGCTVAVAAPREPGATTWPDAVALGTAGACPSVAGADPAALSALLARTTTLQQPCDSAFVAFTGAARWGDVAPVFAAVRGRYDAATLGVAGTSTPGCERGFVLP